MGSFLFRPVLVVVAIDPMIGLTHLGVELEAGDAYQCRPRTSVSPQLGLFCQDGRGVLSRGERFPTLITIGSLGSSRRHRPLFLLLTSDLAFVRGE